MAEDNKAAQNQASANADAQRRAAAEQQQRQQQGGQNTGIAGQQGDQARRSADQATQQRRAQHDAEKKAVAERPQQVGNEGQKPTPTQQENDEIGNGLRHIDDKEDDGSGPDLRFVRRVEADRPAGKYETR